MVSILNAAQNGRIVPDSSWLHGGVIDLLDTLSRTTISMLWNGYKLGCGNAGLDDTGSPPVRLRRRGGGVCDRFHRPIADACAGSCGLCDVMKW
ncbi:hypothetical protein [Methylobacterium sp. WL9]|uniref:hypothetical protein n=1 Tax=Methylobacterium sp. WL9 TaxID=2603898 RepID=UPI001AEE6AE9|nr:hypothetical protein [Methylobacterium sp. WL9]